MRFLGIDYGEKYIGLAISDENGIFAFPYKTLENINKEFIFKSKKKKLKKLYLVYL